MRKLLPLLLFLSALDPVAALTIDVVQVFPETCGNTNGQASILVSGGVPPYTVVWSNGNSTPDLINVSAGTYTVTVTDIDGTEASASVVIPDLPTLPYSEGGSYLVPDGQGGETWGGSLCRPMQWTYRHAHRPVRWHPSL